MRDFIFYDYGTMTVSITRHGAIEETFELDLARTHKRAQDIHEYGNKVEAALKAQPTTEAAIALLGSLANKPRTMEAA